MRIGHQIYYYISEYSIDGSYSLSEPLEFVPKWPGKEEKYYIQKAYINWSQDQVYITVSHNEKFSDYSINAFMKFMGGPSPQNYKPLYQLRNILKKWSNEVRKKVTSSQTVIYYYKPASPFK